MERMSESKSSSRYAGRPGVEIGGVYWTPRQAQVLMLLTSGVESDREIADRMCVAYETVKSWMQDIYNKLPTIRTRVGIALWFDRARREQ